MSLACTRSLFFMAFVSGALALGISYYLEYAVGLAPCGLCLVQRVCLALLTGACLLGAVQGPARFGSSLYWLAGVLCSLVGTLAAGRQVLLQSDPSHHASACASDLVDVFENTPLLCLVRQMFKATSNCAEISWTLFDLSIAEWSLLLFVAMLLLSAWQLLRLLWAVCHRPLGGDSTYRALRGD